ncbi:hypothetical protein TREMEDRAFT_69505 [Tremella mesenterica DSM 1558]|uniref:uncharacterized protein n=1 Tax=Tremella mesenterica (strain ATCC 24925 / CBS 8224 / DSM 1558 / NBRC 9311 / NRRL Y-6157 / RJB 2259-6 / UBC 559-6) TaxID=578456 RepID=UPI0003F4910F|nr:uncharacterized protein TREMEDRAFT_69505 [Tremella mesenterica DSM 1558]EIW67974.1 hypothetical protein TREMEDRAFT_69505 [Tremella mesenterica DSM 1558]
MSFTRLPRLLRIPLPTLIRTVQIVAVYHLFTTDIASIRPCGGFSMLPTLSHDGDWVLISPLPYRSVFRSSSSSSARGPRRGDLVVSINPMKPNETVCKRVIGIQGDIIEVEPRRGRESIWMAEEDDELGNGRVILRDVDSEGRPLRSRRKGEGQWVKIPKGHVWLQGDNISNSTDSRMYGPVPVGIITGKVLARVSEFVWGM